MEPEVAGVAAQERQRRVTCAQAQKRTAPDWFGVRAFAPAGVGTA